MLLLVEDLKFAYSITKAVASDAVAIKESRVDEIQLVQDQDFALSLNVDENLLFQDATDLLEMSRLRAESVDQDYVL